MQLLWQLFFIQKINHKTVFVLINFYWQDYNEFILSKKDTTILSLSILHV